MDSHTLEDTISKIRFITTKPTGEECGELCDSAEADMDIGNTNDFEVTIAVDPPVIHCYPCICFRNDKETAKAISYQSSDYCI